MLVSMCVYKCLYVYLPFVCSLVVSFNLDMYIYNTYDSISNIYFATTIVSVHFDIYYNILSAKKQQPHNPFQNQF